MLSQEESRLGELEEGGHPLSSWLQTRLHWEPEWLLEGMVLGLTLQGMAEKPPAITIGHAHGDFSSSTLCPQTAKLVFWQTGGASRPQNPYSSWSLAPATAQVADSSKEPGAQMECTLVSGTS